MTSGLIQEFGRTQIIPYQRHWDEVQALPAQIFRQLSKLGIMGGCVPQGYGGFGLHSSQYMTVVEEFAMILSINLIITDSLWKMFERM